MEAVIAFAGIALGWVLAELSERRRRFTDARVAAKLIVFELLQARQTLELAASEKGILHRAPATLAWDTYAATLLRWKKAADVMLPVMESYDLIVSDTAMLGMLSTERRAAADAVKAIAEGDSEATVSAMGETERAYLGKKIALAVHRSETLEDSLATYLATIGSRTLPAIDHAVSVLRPYVND